MNPNFVRMVRHYIWIAPLVLGVVFILAGVYLLVQGRNAHDDVRDEIVQENITVSSDAPDFGGQTVDTAGKADAQAEAILEHTLTATGGYLYAEIGRYLLPEGNYMLPNGTYMTADGGTTQDVNEADKDEDGDPIIVTTNEALAAKNSNDEPIRGWTSSSSQAETDAEGQPLTNGLRDTAQTSAFLRTSLGVAVMGFKVSDLVSGLGLFLIVVGAAWMIFIAPAVLYSAAVANHYAELIKDKD